MPFAQLVIGPPGSGKSTYCDGMHQFMSAIGRPSSVVNFDPANDNSSYKPALDVRDLVSLDEIMISEELGPNGGVLYALEELEHNIQWLEDGLKQLNSEHHGTSLRPVWILTVYIMQTTTFYLTVLVKLSSSRITPLFETYSFAWRNSGTESALPFP
jgi:GTPase SAR1 family protein